MTRALACPGKAEAGGRGRKGLHEGLGVSGVGEWRVGALGFFGVSMR